MKHLIKLALVALASVAAYYVYGFTVQVAPFLIAVGAAGSLVGTYVGLAFADIPGDQRPRAMYVARAAMIVEALYGFLFVLAQQSPEWFRAPMHPALSIALAALHGAAFSVLAFFVSLFIVHEQVDAPETPADARDRVIVETLHAIVTRLDAPRLPVAVQPLLEDEENSLHSSARLEMPADRLADQTGQTENEPIGDRKCKVCGADGLTAIEVAQHGKRHKREAVR